MKLFRFLKMLCTLTIVSLIYIQLQSQIYDLSYRGEDKKALMQKLADDNGNLTCSINRLKSANHLGVKLLSENSTMRFLDGNQIIRVQSPLPLVEGNDAVAAKREHAPKRSILASIFSLKSQAEAEPTR